VTVPDPKVCPVQNIPRPAAPPDVSQGPHTATDLMKGHHSQYCETFHQVDTKTI